MPEEENQNLSNNIGVDRQTETSPATVVPAPAALAENPIDPLPAAVPSEAQAAAPAENNQISTPNKISPELTAAGTPENNQQVGVPAADASAPAAMAQNRQIISSAPWEVEIKGLLLKAKEKIFSNRKKKLDRILAFVAQKGSITNDQVQDLVKVSDKTATRYLNQLAKEGKLKRAGSLQHTRYEPI